MTIEALDPAEIRWSTGSVRIGYLGDGRWRVARRRLDATTEGPRVEMSRELLCNEIVAAVSAVPPGEPIPLSVAGTPVVGHDLGSVELEAPGVNDAVRVVLRSDLRGVLPPHVPLVDIRSIIRRGRETVFHQPFVGFAIAWLHGHRERCRATGVPLPPDRLDERFSAASFEAAVDPARLATSLDAVIARRLEKARDPDELIDTVIAELGALGHECTFSDSNGVWMLWASPHLVVAWDPREGPVGTCRVTTKPDSTSPPSSR